MSVSFSEFVKVCERVRSTNSIIEKVDIIASFMSNMDRDEWKPFVMLLAGRPVPEYSEGGLGIGFSSIKRALKFRYRPLFPSSSPSIVEVFVKLNKIASIKGKGSVERRIGILSTLFNSLDEDEVDWLIRTIFGELRIGVEEGHILHALSKVTNIPLDVIRRAYLLRGSLDDLIDMILVGSDEIQKVKPVLFKPVRPMLATPASSIIEAFNMVGGGRVAVETKYDGARVQIHVGSRGVKIFSRRLTDVSESFSEIVALIKDKISIKVSSAIFEGEVIAYKGGRPLPFQILMRRFRRVKDVDKIIVEIPTKVYLFDIIFLNDSLLIDSSYEERYSILSGVVTDDLLADRILTDNVSDAEEFYKKALEEGHEGVMIKKLDSPYILGSRGKNWIKVKPSETVDLVIVGAEWGHGRRRGWLSDYYLATYNKETGGYDIVGKTFKGLTDDEFQYMTKRLLAIKVRDEGYRIWVKPQIVVEVAFNEIQQSPKYKSGMALRLARITRIREDKRPVDATSTEELRSIYKNQIKFRSLK